MGVGSHIIDIQETFFLLGFRPLIHEKVTGLDRWSAMLANGKVEKSIYPSMEGFTVKAISAVNGATLWQFTDPDAGQIWRGQVKRTIDDMVQTASPFSIRLMV